MPLPLLAGAFGANLLSGLIGTSGARKRARRLRQLQLSALSPLEALMTQSGFGAGESEGSIMNSVTRRTLGSLGARGVLNSSMAPGEVAASVAPIEERRQARRQGLAERLAAARQAIYASTQAPGYEEAFAGSLGEFGGLLALLGGEQYGGNTGMDKTSMDITSGTPPEPFRSKAQTFEEWLSEQGM